ncbi:MAG: polysaccharide deacetylase family protein (PEP-CTERM system associated) [Motiliproteus sp.]|jgi:polysaccharide deacetylase family protein (PEP-CTERM system associated)
MQLPTKKFAITFDIEDYFQVSAFEKQSPFDRWPSYPCRVEANTEQLLAILDQNSTQATFFILGWVAERYPELIKRIALAGHEIASHGYNHQRINLLSRKQFQEDSRSAKQLLEDLTGNAVQGYRAPSFSFSEQTPWTFDVLLEAGYRYSSSINPVPHDLYGYPNAARTVFYWDNGLLEIPVTTCELLGRRIPCAGGGYFRLYPYPLFKWLMRRACQQLDGPGIFYLHPWELDPEQPRIEGASLKSRFRHYINLHKTEPRLQQLLQDFDWGRMIDLEIVQQACNSRKP